MGMKQKNELGARKKITLAEQLNLTGTKPAVMLFHGKEFNYKRSQGWKGLYVDLAAELYSIAPQAMKSWAESQQEFFISDEPALWSVGNRKPAENYEDNWWVKVGNNVFIYTKNNTNAKIQRMRGLCQECGIALVDITIVLY